MAYPIWEIADLTSMTYDAFVAQAPSPVLRVIKDTSRGRPCHRAPSCVGGTTLVSGASWRATVNSPGGMLLDATCRKAIERALATRPEMEENGRQERYSHPVHCG